MSTETTAADWIERVEQQLQRLLAPPPPSLQRLLDAMRHASLGGGKRLRPQLVYATGSTLGCPLPRLDAAAAAVELIHVYSLVHDDLPAMDDDAVRRGKPTVHIAFDEATAILAGDALHSLAFASLARADLAAEQRVAMLDCLADAAGAFGMCGGQAIDIGAVGGRLDESQLSDMHARKTGALIRAAVRLGGLAAAAPSELLAVLDDYARALGLAFQIKDDLLDVESDSATLGKTAGKDAAQGKPTYVALLGVSGARARLQQQAQHMHAALQRLPMASPALAELARQVVERQH